MSAHAPTVTVPRGKNAARDRTVIGVISPVQDSDLSHDDMATRTRDDDRLDRIEAIVETMAKSQAAPVNGEKRRMNWFMASIATITILGAGGNFIGSSGIWIGDRNRDATDVKELKAKYENIRTLYLIRFGEDPDTTTPETMKRRVQTQPQERK